MRGRLAALAALAAFAFRLRASLFTARPFPRAFYLQLKKVVDDMRKALSTKTKELEEYQRKYKISVRSVRDVVSERHGAPGGPPPGVFCCACVSGWLAAASRGRWWWLWRALPPATVRRRTVPDAQSSVAASSD